MLEVGGDEERDRMELAPHIRYANNDDWKAAYVELERSVHVKHMSGRMSEVAH